MKETRYTNTPRPEADLVQLDGFDYIEFYVGNAHHAAHYYRTAFVFRPIAYSGLETGSRDPVSVVVEQGKVRMVLTSAAGCSGPVAEHISVHGDGVKDIAFTVDNAAQAFETAVKKGAQPIMEPTALEDEQGQVIKATVAAFGDTEHSFIERAKSLLRFIPAELPYPWKQVAGPIYGHPLGRSHSRGRQTGRNRSLG